MKIFYDKRMLKIMLQFISRDEFVPFITEIIIITEVINRK